MCTILSAYVFWKEKRFSATSWLSLIAPLLDDSTPVPRSVENVTFYRYIFIAWGPVALLLTNCYSGLITTELSAPLKQTRPSRFEDLICRNSHLLKLPAKDGIAQVKKSQEFGRHLAYYKSPHFWLSTINPLASDDCYAMLSPPIIDHWGVKMYSLLFKFSKFDWIFDEPTWAKKGFVAEELLEVLLMNMSHSLIPSRLSKIKDKSNLSMTDMRELVEQDVTDCGKKRVFVSPLENMQAKFSGIGLLRDLWKTKGRDGTKSVEGKEPGGEG
ncbi:hypothetical protein Fcan01_23315 [Folsomia candida]|uniref:Uncharacterized protein n=1 Tax=Folsomia candida TaxID=158441 RepID=A0A226DAR9_FOLCA|nr:hypothetical protein Fcan01_23315 [Folsomia candida]